MAGEIDEALHDRKTQKFNDHVVVDFSARSIFKVPKPLREIKEKAYEPQVISIGPYHHGKEHLKAMEVQKMNNLKSNLPANRVQIYVMELEQMETEIRAFYLENLDHISSEDLVEMMLLDGFFIIELISGRNNALASFYRGNVKRDLLLVENQLPLSVLSKLYSLSLIDRPRNVANNENDIVANNANDIFLEVITFFGETESRLPIEVPAGNQDAKHMLGLLHDNITRRPQGSPRSATVVFCPWCQPCLAWAGRLQYPCWLPCSTSPPEEMSEQRKSCLIPSATELSQAGIKFQKKGGKLFDIEFQKEVMSIPTLRIDYHTESTFRNFVAYEQCYTGVSSTPFTDYITFMDCLINTGKDVELLCRCGVLDNWLGDHEVVATMFNRLRDSVFISETNFFYSEIFNGVNEYCNAQCNLWRANLCYKYFNSPWALISFIAAVVLLLCTFLQTLFSILSYRY